MDSLIVSSAGIQPAYEAAALFRFRGIFRVCIGRGIWVEESESCEEEFPLVSEDSSEESPEEESVSESEYS